jgi:alginate O-acetyltransferase complex protein AlgI
VLFCSPTFLLFFAAVFLTYWAIPWQRGRVWFLLACSFGFYASWNIALAGLVTATSAMDYAIGRGLDATESKGPRRLLLTCSLVVNLGLLAYFKYANFFLESLQQTLNAIGCGVSFPVLSVILPLGISFYTFEAISYTVDVYRRRIPAERNLAHFMLFILFFPHLIAGPIVRGRDFLPQIARRKRWRWGRMNVGVQLFLLGIIKKVIFADPLGELANAVFDPHLPTISPYSTAALWAGTLAWTIQVYCDFSGYSDMAIGCAHMLGYKLCRNFDLPYLSANISEFWRRWHISLSTWIRDYLFFPLGGSRCSAARTAANLLIVMTLAGLWHGANWPFVVFGVIQGIYLIAHRFFRDFATARPGLDRLLQTPAGTALRVAVTFGFFVLSLAVFRAPTLMAGANIVSRMLIPTAGLALPFPASRLWVPAAALAIGHALAYDGAWKRLIARLPAPAVGFGQAAIIMLAILFAAGSDKAFVYFQF